MLQYAPWTLSPGYNIEKGRRGRNVKLEIEKLTRLSETGLFQGVSQLLLSMIGAFHGLSVPNEQRAKP